MTIHREKNVMKALHSDKTSGSRFLLRQSEGLEEINGLPALLTPYFGKTFTHYRDHKWKGDEKKIKRFAKGLCQGLAYMHEKGYAHRDIKPDNILLQNAEGDPIIIDFGLVNDSSRRSGTPKYLAPEQLGPAGPHKEKEWWNLDGWDQRKFDSFALGSLLMSCFEKHDAPIGAVPLIMGLLDDDPKKRFNMQQALAQPWFKEPKKKSADEILFSTSLVL